MKPRLCVLSAGLLMTLCTMSQAQTPLKLTFESAWERVKSSSDQLAAAQAGVDSKNLQSQGLQGLGGPVVQLGAAAYSYNLNLNLNLDPVNKGLAQIVQRLPASLQSIASNMPQFPSSYNYNQSDSGITKTISFVWPLYTGGVTDAVRGFVQAQGDEARADADKTSQTLATQLVQRYFGAQLSSKAASLRLAALDDIAEHDAATAKMLSAGVISRVERLQAQVAFEDAKRQSQKAQSDVELAAVALARTLQSDTRVAPTTPLFVLTQPIEPLTHFLSEALDRHPGLAKVMAKQAQAEQLHRGQEGLRKPQVFAFGLSELQTSRADWVAGVGVTWTLFDAVDRDKLEAASAKQIEQAQRTELQARNDISLLVEKNWRQVEQARRQFLATEPGVTLAKEVLRLRRAALREGTGTVLELMDADVNLAKVETERAQVAYDYVLALANLLESCGLSDSFSIYANRADVRIEGS
jgi:outer membrane protein TolC